MSLMLHIFFFFLMIRRPPRSTRTDTLFPYTTLFRSFADDRFKQEQVRRRDNRTYSLALLIVLGLIHRDKHFKLKRAFVAVHVLDRDAAQLGFRRKDLVVGKIGRASWGKECVSTCRFRWSPYN